MKQIMWDKMSVLDQCFSTAWIDNKSSNLLFENIKENKGKDTLISLMTVWQRMSSRGD